MAKITLEWEVGDKLDDILVHFTDFYGYEGKSHGSRASFAKRVIGQHIKEAVETQLANKAASTERLRVSREVSLD